MPATITDIRHNRPARAARPSPHHAQGPRPQTQAAPVTVAQAPRSHAHRWRIEEARGQYSNGTCTLCGERKLFRNWIAETDFMTATDYALGTAEAVSA